MFKPTGGLLSAAPRRRGFTMTELITVVVCAAIFAVLALTGFDAVKNRTVDWRTAKIAGNLLGDAQFIAVLNKTQDPWPASVSQALIELNETDGNTTWLIGDEGVQSPYTDTFGWNVVEDGVIISLLSPTGRLCTASVTDRDAKIQSACDGEAITGAGPSTGSDGSTNPSGNGGGSGSSGTPTQTGPTVVAPTDSVSPGSLELTLKTGVVGTVVLSWTAVETRTTSTSTAPVTGYRIYKYDPVFDAYTLFRTVSGTTVELSGGSEPFTPGDQVSFRVAPYNSAGEGPMSDTVSITVIDVPADPVSQSRTTTGDGSPQFSYDITINDGQPLTDAVLRLTNPVDNTIVSIPLIIGDGVLNVTVPIGDLEPGATYDVDVILDNQLGTIVIEDDPITVVGAPDVPSITSATLTSAEGSVNVDWTAVESTTQRPVSGYRLFVYSAPTDSYVQMYQGTALTTTITDLTLGQEARFMVSAYGASAESARSAIATRMVIGRPAEPSTVSYQISNGTAVTVEISLSSVIARPVDSISLTVSQSGSTVTTATAAVNGSSATALIPAGVLAVDELYQVSMQLGNTFGSRGYDGADLDLEDGLPSAPRTVVATGADASINVSFAAPADSGAISVLDTGSSVQQYRATCIGAGAEYTAVASGSPVTVTGLPNEVTYTCTVTARNVNGWGTESAPKTATPMAGVPLLWSSDGDANGLFNYVGTSGGTSAWTNPANLSAPTRISLTSPLLSDRNTSTLYTPKTAFTSGGSIANGVVIMPSGKMLRPTRYTINGPNDSGTPTSWTLKGRKADGSFVTLDTQSGNNCTKAGSASWCSIPLSTTEAFNQFSLSFTGSDIYYQFNEFEFYGYYVNQPTPVTPVANVTQIANTAAKMTFTTTQQISEINSFTATCTGTGGATTRTAAATAANNWTAYLTNMTANGTYSCTAAVTGYGGTSTSSAVALTMITSSRVALLQSSFNDTNGLFYYLGTAGGTAAWSNPQVSGAVTLSTNNLWNAALLTNRNLADTGSTPLYMANSNAKVVLPTGTNLIPTSVSLKYHNPGSLDASRSWRLLGSNDDTNWNTVYSRAGAGENDCTSSGCIYSIPAVPTVGYRYFVLEYYDEGYLMLDELEISGFYKP
jgi:type II secretory pathway pseudopilin PulG